MTALLTVAVILADVAVFLFLAAGDEIACAVQRFFNGLFR